jgi:putative Flp pilus-assembly TadE/G-like protein
MRSDRGQTIVLLLVLLPVLILVAGMVIDGGNAFAQKRKVQSAADAAALAAAQELMPALGGTCDAACMSAVRAAVGAKAGEYSAENGGSATLEDCGGDPAKTNCYSWPYGSNGKVEVRLQNTVDGFFTSFLSLGSGFFKPSARAVASAAAIAGDPGCDGVPDEYYDQGCKITGTVDPGGPGGPTKGAYIYTDGDLRIDNSAVEQPIITRGDLDVSHGTVWPVARLVSVDGKVIYGGNPALGNGPTTRLGAVVPAASTGPIPVQSVSGFEGAGMVMFDEAGTSADEWIQYTGINAAPARFQGTITRGYGGFDAPGASSHGCTLGAAGCPADYSAEPIMDGRLSELHAQGGCASGAAAVGTLAQCATKTTLAAAVAAGATNIKVASVAGMAANDSLTLDPIGIPTTVRITAVGTAGPTGTGVTFAPALAAAYANGTDLMVPENQIYASVVDQTPIAFTKPTFDIAQAYLDAAPGPRHPCTTQSGTPPVFDVDTTLNGNLTPVPRVLTPATSYTCTATAPDGSVGELSWNVATRTLTVHGTVFFDGSIDFTGSNRYVTGSEGATIITSRDVFPFSAGESLCAAGTGGAGGWTCDFANWDPSVDLLGLVAGRFPGSTFTNCMAFMGAAGGSGYQGAFYVDGYQSPKTRCDSNNETFALRVAAAGATVQGLFVVGGDARWSAGSGNPSPSIAELPHGFPGAGDHCFIDADGDGIQEQRDDLLPTCEIQGTVRPGGVTGLDISMEE